MTTDGLSKPRQATEAMDARDGYGSERGHGFRSSGGPTTTVPVIPLWARPRTGARG